MNMNQLLENIQIIYTRKNIIDKLIQPTESLVHPKILENVDLVTIWEDICRKALDTYDSELLEHEELIRTKNKLQVLAYDNSKFIEKIYKYLEKQRSARDTGDFKLVKELFNELPSEDKQNYSILLDQITTIVKPYQDYKHGLLLENYHFLKDFYKQIYNWILDYKKEKGNLEYVPDGIQEIFAYLYYTLNKKLGIDQQIKEILYKKKDYLIDISKKCRSHNFIEQFNQDKNKNLNLARQFISEFSFLPNHRYPTLIFGPSIRPLKRFQETYLNKGNDDTIVDFKFVLYYCEIINALMMHNLKELSKDEIKSFFDKHQEYLDRTLYLITHYNEIQKKPNILSDPTQFVIEFTTEAKKFINDIEDSFGYFKTYSLYLGELYIKMPYSMMIYRLPSTANNMKWTIEIIESAIRGHVSFILMLYQYRNLYM